MLEIIIINFKSQHFWNNVQPMQREMQRGENERSQQSQKVAGTLAEYGSNLEVRDNRATLYIDLNSEVQSFLPHF